MSYIVQHKYSYNYKQRDVQSSKSSAAAACSSTCLYYCPSVFVMPVCNPCICLPCSSKSWCHLRWWCAISSNWYLLFLRRIHLSIWVWGWCWLLVRANVVYSTFYAEQLQITFMLLLGRLERTNLLIRRYGSFQFVEPPKIALLKYNNCSNQRKLHTHYEEAKLYCWRLFLEWYVLIQHRQEHNAL